ncbi:fatty acid synthase [Rhipicephalus microplus]|uniref:fatty acid synthase n=1 Tax=Rhipicephalus microplus TaxID=6941 RepID=UPI003F6BA9DB
MQGDDIVISGFSAYFPQADHLVEFKQKLYAGVEMVTEDDSRWPPGYNDTPKVHGKIKDLSRFDAQFFSTHPKQAHVMDPQMRLLLETSYEAILDAGYDPEALRKRKIGVFIGNSSSETSEAFKLDRTKVEGYVVLGSLRAMFSNRISYSLDLLGPSMTIDTACSSTMVALSEALLAMRSGRCEAAIVGGAGLTLDPHLMTNYNLLGILSKDGKSRPFDTKSNGYVRSETVGAFFLQRYSNARRVYARVINAIANADGFKEEGVPYPSVTGHERLLRDAYSEVDVDPTKVVYVEAHGTGTKAGGIQELEAISNVICSPRREKPLLIGSVKSNMGHSESASGISAVAKVILAMETGTIAANINFDEPDPAMPSLHDGRIKVVDRPTPFDGGMIGISSQGIGGANAHAILDSNPGPHAESLPRQKPYLPRLIIMSGRSKEALMQTLNRIETEGPYPDSGYALLNRIGQRSVKQFPYRGFAIVPVDDVNREVVKVLERARPEKRPIWFVFNGVGCQWNGMGRHMMQFQPFAESIRKSHTILKEKVGEDLMDMLIFSEPQSKTIKEQFASIAAVQVALVDTLQALRVQPDGLLGHSVGEVGCAYADGCFTAEQALLAAYWRGHCLEMGYAFDGAMAAVGLTWEEAERRCPPDVYPACHNAEDFVTVAGTAEAVEKMVEQLQAENVFARKVDSMGVAFHTKHVNHIGPIFHSTLEKIIPQPKPRSKRWISTSAPESRWKEPGALLCSAEYQTNNFVSPVLFCEALKHVPEDAILLEIGPHCLLQAILRRAVGPDASCVGLMKRHVDNVEYFLRSLGKLHILGVEMDLSVMYPPVPWPLPRGTPNIGHLVGWDHSQSWDVAQWKDFPSPEQAKEDILEVGIEAHSKDNYLAGHQLDGRVLFPGTGYVVFAWQFIASQYGRHIHDTPVIVEDIKIQRFTILPPSGCVRFQITMMPITGDFEVCEGGAVVCKGRIRVAEEGEKVLLKDPPGKPSEGIVFDMDCAEVYKELRLRGYQYHGLFQGAFKAVSQKPYAKLKWQDNWVTFMDSLVHMSFIWKTKREFVLPLAIQSIRIDPKVHARITEIVGDEGVDLVYNSHYNMRQAGGVEIQGVKVNTVQRRPMLQTPIVEDYRFVPYIDDEITCCQRENLLREYIEVCKLISQRALKMSEENNSHIAIASNSCVEVPEMVLNQYIDNVTPNHALLQLLIGIDKQVNDAAALPAAIKSALLASASIFEEDVLSTTLLEEDPLRDVLDVVLENTSSVKVRVLELTVESTLAAIGPRVSTLLSMYSVNLKTEYMLLNINSTTIALRELDEVTEPVSPRQSLVSQGKLIEADLVIAFIGILRGFGHLNNVAETMASHCKEHGFLLLCHRTALTAAEALLSKTSGVPFHVYSVEMTTAALRSHGFKLVALKSNNLSTLLLFRKVSLTVDVTKQTIVMVQNEQFSWIDSLKKKVAEYESKPVGENIWILAEDSGQSGILGLTNCLRKENIGQRIRCVFDATLNSFNHVTDFSAAHPAYKDILEKDLVMNVYCDGQWGSYRHRNVHWSGEAKTTTQFAYLNVQTPGDLSSLQWYESPLRYLSPCDKIGFEEAYVDVYYAAVNFRDVMLASGKLNLDSSRGDNVIGEAFLGMEYSGRDWNGRRVMGIVKGQSIASVLTVDPALTWDIPESWSMEEAATVPMAYSTAYYALILRAGMQTGESVLIHNGSGGVGQAAISIALSMGCEIFTTVGTNDKREFIKLRFPALKDKNIANSRDLSFEEHVMNETDGHGVNLVLNSLSDEKLQASLRCLATHGRFVEIGKLDLFENNDLGMSVFLQNVNFHGVMLDSLWTDDPIALAHKRSLNALLAEGIKSGVVQPLNAFKFIRGETEEAFRFIASGGHIGKVVIQIRPEEDERVTRAPPLILEAVARPHFYRHKSYVIVGGLGGIGLELAQWMVTRGCRKLLLISRSGIRTGYQRLALKRWTDMGATVLVSTDDVSTKEGARKIIETASSFGPMGGIFNLAMVLRDALIENQTAEMYAKVCKPKVLATQSLDEVSRQQCPELDHFVVFSSFSCGRGQVGQTSYGFANSVAERLCERRVADGLPGLAIQWGPFGEVGAFYESMRSETQFFGVMPQPINSCLAVMDYFLSQKQPTVSCFVKSTMSSTQDGGEKRNLVESVARILGVKDPSKLNSSVSLGELGIDSMMGIEVKQLLEREYDVTLSMQETRQLTISQIKEIGEASLRQQPALEASTLVEIEELDQTVSSSEDRWVI